MMIINCPWCNEYIIIEEVNCGIFRHGYDINYNQINPHGNMEYCISNTIYGCGKPFSIINGIIQQCSYNT